MMIGAIIAMLATIALSSLDTSKAKARDAKKIREIQDVQTALELFRLNGNGDYPQPKDVYGNDIIAMNNADMSKQTMSDTLAGLVDSKYLNSIPYPPKGSSVPGDTYYYATVDDGTNIRCGTRTLGAGGVPYIIYFTTELPQKLTPLYINNALINAKGYGYCFTLN